jgi:hypothetical protein
MNTEPSAYIALLAKYLCAAYTASLLGIKPASALKKIERQGKVLERYWFQLADQVQRERTRRPQAGSQN